ncbi:MAG: response regulator transcription factor [Bacteroidetes bacterium]|nr:response regulator transcription factor [Bacteroidota bacterium]
MKDAVNILIVDDNPVYKTGLKTVLTKTNLFASIFEAKNGIEAIVIVKTEEIDLILMDISMPEMNGVEATAKILKLKPNIKIIALTMFCDSRYVYEIFKNGAKGYLLKDANNQEICKAIQMVLNGDEYYSPKVQVILASVYRDYNKHSSKYDEHFEITSMQKEVLQLLCKQYSSEDIAKELNLSVNTVYRHRQDLLDRTKSSNLAGLVIYAIEQGIIYVGVK